MFGHKNKFFFSQKLNFCAERNSNILRKLLSPKYSVWNTVHPPICHTPIYPKTRFIRTIFGHENVTNRVRGGFQNTKCVNLQGKNAIFWKIKCSFRLIWLILQSVSLVLQFLSFENELMFPQIWTYKWENIVRMISFTDPICHISPELSPKPDLSPLFFVVKMWQIGGCTVRNFLACSLSLIRTKTNFLCFFLSAKFFKPINFNPNFWRRLFLILIL